MQRTKDAAHTAHRAGASPPAASHDAPPASPPSLPRIASPDAATSEAASRDASDAKAAPDAMRTDATLQDAGLPAFFEHLGAALPASPPASEPVTLLSLPPPAKVEPLIPPDAPQAAGDARPASPVSVPLEPILAGTVAISLNALFLSKPGDGKLTLWPVRPYETLVHPDGTGLTEQHFSAYFDERYAKDRKKQKALREGKKADGPRKHHWSYAEILWTYRYTMVAAIHTAQEQFGEAPWLTPLMERAVIMLNIKEVGGDKAYDSNAIYRYAREHGIDAQIKIRNTPFPSYSHSGKKYRKAHMIAARLDPEGFAAKANRRNNAETGNHAFKAILGDQIYSKSAQAQRNEILCMCIAYNLTRLVFAELTTATVADFTGGVQALRTTQWRPLVASTASPPEAPKMK
jgi:hypothetical protein